MENIFKRFLDFVSLLDKEMTKGKGRSSVTVDFDLKFEQFLQRLRYKAVFQAIGPYVTTAIRWPSHRRIFRHFCICFQHES